jgi:hypothetical protein
MTAAYLNIKNIYLPQAAVPETQVPGMINLVLTLCIIVCVFIIFLNAIPSWIRAFRSIPSEAKATV